MPCSVTFRQTARNCPIPTQRRLQPVALLTGLGVLSGSGDGMLHPQSKLTREQALKLAVELLAALNG